VETKRYNDSETFVKDPFIVISRVGVKAQDYGTLNEDRNTSQQLIVDKSIVNSHPAKWFCSLLSKRKKHFHGNGP
jgi:hypothetical protein